MSWSTILFAVFCLTLISTIVWWSRHNAMKNEIQWRRQHFETIVAGKSTPRAAVDWLTYQLLGKESVYPDNKRQFTLSLTDLGIEPDKYYETIRHCLRMCWRDLNLRKPTIKEAAHGLQFVKNETRHLIGLMEVHSVTPEELAVDIESVQSGYMNRCCMVLEEGLYRYPDRAFQELPAPKLMQVLKEIWPNPEPERMQKWQDWVLAAKKRHAYRLLVRLREGRYFFPDSDERVTRLLRYLDKAGATPEDIGTSDQELEDLRGFRYKTKQNK